MKIEGRADGIFTDGDLTVIDEIKGVYLPVQDLEKPLFIHQAQAMCYAYIVAENENLDAIGVQLTYCHLETEQVVRFRETFSRIEIVQWFRNLMDEYENGRFISMTGKAERCIHYGTYLSIFLSSGAERTGGDGLSYGGKRKAAVYRGTDGGREDD